jgi:hypothetical protein
MFGFFRRKARAKAAGVDEFGRPVTGKAKPSPPPNPPPPPPRRKSAGSSGPGSSSHTYHDNSIFLFSDHSSSPAPDTSSDWGGSGGDWGGGSDFGGSGGDW